MYQLILDLNKKGTTILMISHDIEAAVHYASHILHIGEELFYGTKQDYVQSSLGKRYLKKEA